MLRLTNFPNSPDIAALKPVGRGTAVGTLVTESMEMIEAVSSTSTYEASDGGEDGDVGAGVKSF